MAFADNRPRNEEWKLARVASLATYLGSGISRPFVAQNIGRPVLRSNNVRDGRIVLDEVKYWYEKDPRGADLTKVAPVPGDILVNFVNGSRKELGKAAVYRGELPGCIVSTNLFIVRFDSRRMRREFANCFFQSAIYKEWLYTTTGFAGPGSFNQRDFGNLLIPVPEPKVQDYIINVLRSWDSAEDRLKLMITAKSRFKDGLARRLLTGKQRLPESGGPLKAGHRPEGWEYPKTSQLFRSISKKNHGHDVVLSVTQDQGVIPRKCLDRKINMTEGNTNTYKLVEQGDFIISLRSFQGGLEYSSYRGLVSPAYHVIRPIIEGADGFYRHYFKSQEFIKRLAVAIIGIRDGKQVSYDDFSFMHIPRPPIEEQRKIAAVLDSIDREIALLTKYAGALSRQKNTLMQKLLTGQIRVKV